MQFKDLWYQNGLIFKKKKKKAKKEKAPKAVFQNTHYADKKCTRLKDK